MKHQEKTMSASWQQQTHTTKSQPQTFNPLITPAYTSKYNICPRSVMHPAPTSVQKFGTANHHPNHGYTGPFNPNQHKPALKSGNRPWRIYFTNKKAVAHTNNPKSNTNLENGNHHPATFGCHSPPYTPAKPDASTSNIVINTDNTNPIS